ncbi:hypothetical protein [Pseudoalteromonas sp.]|uniref:hypothetical protein n=1 Tax=Pseudoalteromonas sp. TaxID=53249 RepID=UPI003D146F0C
MTKPVTIFRWDDTGAPQVTEGRPSEYLNIFKKCLVEGYGEKSSLGWSLLDEDTESPFCAFRNDISNGGSGGVAMFGNTSDDVGQMVIVRGVQDYVDRNSYTRSSPFHAFDRASSGSNLNKYWILIGTSTAFYFFCYSDSSMESNKTGTRHIPSFFMGDIISLIPNDPAPFICISGSKDSTTTSWSYSLIYKISESTMDKLSSIHPIDGSDDPKEFSIISLFSQYGYISGTHIGEPNIRMLSPCYALMYSGNLTSSSAYQNNTHPFARGLIPGLFVASDAGYRDDIPPVIKELNGESHYLIPSCNSTTGCTWINLESW